MKLYMFASGSAGNCALVSHNGTNLLIDCGISMRRISACLRSIDMTEADLDAVLITHEHSDHVSGLATMSKYFSIPVYASLGTADALEPALPNLRKLNAFCAGACFEVGCAAVKSFKTPHDASDSVGYRLEAGGCSISFATDLGHMPESVLSTVLGSDAAVLEANHDVEMLKNGQYPQFLKSRILGKRGHLSNEDCAATAALLERGGTRLFMLAHLSRENNTPELARGAVGRALSAAPGGARLAVAAAASTVSYAWD